MLFLSEINFFLHAIMVNVPKGVIANTVLKEMFLILRMDFIFPGLIKTYLLDKLDFDEMEINNQEFEYYGYEHVYLVRNMGSFVVIWVVLVGVCGVAYCFDMWWGMMNRMFCLF